MPVAIRTEKLTRRFGALAALQPLDFVVDRGEALAIFGPNGAGKSTLLRLCATLLRPSGGRVEVFEVDLASSSAAIRRRIGVVSHQSFLYPDLTPTENLTFYARMFGVQDVAARVGELLDRVDLHGWSHQPVRTLSRGLEQRCSLARALVHSPDLLLLDEPFTGLDLAAAQSIETLLREERTRRGITTILTTHDFERAFALCERGLILARGRLRWDGALSGSTVGRFADHYAAATGAAPAAAGDQGSGTGDRGPER